MSTAIDLAFLVLTLLLAFGAPLLLVAWIRAAANWCWLLAIRGRLVGAVSFVVLLAVTVFLRVIFGLHFMSPLAVLAGIYVTPLAAIPLANLIAQRLAPATGGPKQKARDFIFRERRREQSDAYSAPSAEI
ncbi:hypothetical protein [Sphingomonas sp. 2SG]|uniref:hypothetical protein n=1 Tax=Sphingomonas sp. 2SG TaxID=2502201 RepID=UPI0010F9D1A4|nr:hypothetical protein [Sphingomonas sp. 2SG]